MQKGDLQKRIIDLAQRQNLYELSLKDIAETLNEKHRQSIKHHLDQLKKKGIIVTDHENKKVIVAEPKGYKFANLFNLPILGSADCGRATTFAYEKIRGYLKVSSGIVGKKSPDGLFVVKASGDSLDQADTIPGGPVKDGDYVIVDCKNKDPQDGDYVLSVIDEQANLKRFYKDKKNRQIRLMSESSLNLPPIIIDFKDYSSNPSYFINGVAIRVIKK